MAEKVIYNLLSNNSALTAVVPASRIFGGTIPLKTALPAIAYGLVSGVDDTAIGLTTIKTRSRVQVSVAAKTYPEVKAIISLINDACNNKQGTFNGVKADSIIKDLVGPDFSDDRQGIYFQTIDFKINHE